VDRVGDVSCSGELRVRWLADCEDQAGQVLGRARTTTREREAAVVLLSSFCRRAGLLMMRSRENHSHRVSD
jgi:hypothetical protein